MSKLRRQDFYCGAALAILFRKNEHISPSIVENVSDTEGKNVVGTFYKIRTQSGNEAILYTKFSSNQQTIKNLTKAWKFSLTDVEKEKINKQIEKSIPFFVALVCAEQINRDNIFGEIALLTIKDYKQISHRSNIIIGLWSDENDETKTERPKLYVLKVGKGNSRNYYYEVKRNQIEIPLDNLIHEYYPQYCNLKKESTVESNIDSELLEADNKINVYVTDDPRICTKCQSMCTYKLIDYLKADKTKHQINVAICSKCNRKHINLNYYNTFIKGNKKSNISFEVQDKNKVVSFETSQMFNKTMSGKIIRCLLLSYRDDDICPIHNSKMESVYVHIGKMGDTAYYCNQCNKYMISNQRYMKLLQNLGRKAANIEFEAILEK